MGRLATHKITNLLNEDRVNLCRFLLTPLIPPWDGNHSDLTKILLPGQSQNIVSLSTNMVWKCLVLPGVADTEHFLASRIAFIVELLPTFG